jgi:hypothetical protein
MGLRSRAFQHWQPDSHVLRVACRDLLIWVAEPQHGRHRRYPSVAGERDAHLSLTLYRGATIDDPVEGIFSFVPARRVDAEDPASPARRSDRRSSTRPASRAPGAPSVRCRPTPCATLGRSCATRSSPLTHCSASCCTRPTATDTTWRAASMPGNTADNPAARSAWPGRLRFA